MNLKRKAVYVFWNGNDWFPMAYVYAVGVAIVAGLIAGVAVDPRHGVIVACALFIAESFAGLALCFFALWGSRYAVDSENIDIFNDRHPSV